jgi:hypothetical protein
MKEMPMANIKHVGRLKTNKRKVIVPYRTLPNDPYHALVVFVDTLSADEHDSLIRVVESSPGQDAYELAEVMNRSFLPDGRNMLVGFHKTGKLQKIATSDIEMIPNSTSAVGLDELNQLIATQRGISLEDLSLKSDNRADTNKPKEVPAEPAAAVAETTAMPTNEPLSDADLARKYRSDADRLSKEAAALRRMAEELVPTKKPTTTLIKPKAKTQESA